MHNNMISSIANYVPKSILENVMQMVVKHCYNNNNYNEVYRNRKKTTKFERFAINAYLKALPSNNPYIVDIGCGAGIPYDAYFVSHGCRVLGIDISRRQITKAIMNVPSAKFVNMNFLKYQDNCLYDGIVMLYSLYHIQREYHPIVIQKIYNMLNPKGKVLINIRTEDCGKLKYRSNFCGRPMCWSHYDYNTFLYIIQKIGFEYEILGDEKQHGSSESHVWLIMSKKSENGINL